MTACAGEAVLVPEQHSEVGAGIVARCDESAIHIRMAARFEAQQLAQLVHVGVIDGEYPALGNCVALDIDRGVRDDAERFAGGVVVDGRNTQVRHVTPVSLDRWSWWGLSGVVVAPAL